MLKINTTLFFLCISLALFSQGYTITSFNSDLTINEDWTVDVIETIDVDFKKKKRGIIRNIPRKYKLEGKEIVVNIEDVKVKNHKYSVQNKSRNRSIKIGDKDIYLQGPQSYTISYTLNPGILQHDVWQELHIDVIGTEWDTQIEEASFTVQLPSDYKFRAEDMALGTGKLNESKRNGNIFQIDNRRIKGNTTKTLKAKENLSIALKFPKDYLDISKRIVAPKETEKNPLVEQKPWYIIFPLSILGYVLVFWRRKRNTHQVADGSPQYYAPEGLTSAHVGTLYDHSANDRDIVSLLPYWATEGFLTIERKDEKMTLHKIKNLDEDYPSYEHMLFDKLFEESDSMPIEDLSSEFYSTLNKVKAELKKEVESHGYYDKSYDQWFKSWKIPVLSILIIISSIILIILTQQIFAGIIGILSGIGLVFLMIPNTPHSKFGAQIHAQLRSLARFLKNPNEEIISKISKEDPQYFERMFPYAVALGYDEKWTSAFSNIGYSTPVWYQGNDETGLSGFSKTINSKNMVKAFENSAPAEYTGSGYNSGSGSVSSGGGMGGGGGSSW